MRACHSGLINPVGFAFEHYDAIGAWRDVDNAVPIDAKATFMLDNQSVSYDGAVELAKLIAQSRQFYDCYAKNWLEYALGRSPVDGGRRFDRSARHDVEGRDADA